VRGNDQRPPLAAASCEGSSVDLNRNMRNPWVLFYIFRSVATEMCGQWMPTKSRMTCCTYCSCKCLWPSLRSTISIQNVVSICAAFTFCWTNGMLMMLPMFSRRNRDHYSTYDILARDSRSENLSGILDSLRWVQTVPGCLRLSSGGTTIFLRRATVPIAGRRLVLWAVTAECWG